MKICFNLFPPANKMIAFLVCILLLLAYTKLRADDKIKDDQKISCIKKQYKSKHFVYTEEFVALNIKSRKLNSVLIDRK